MGEDGKVDQEDYVERQDEDEVEGGALLSALSHFVAAATALDLVVVEMVVGMVVHSVEDVLELFWDPLVAASCLSLYYV